MPSNDDTLTFRKRELKGSRLRCLMATHQSDQKVAEFLTSLVQPYAAVDPAYQWAPRGFLHPGEAKWGETPVLFSDSNREVVTAWWFKVGGSANPPNWDLVSPAMIRDRP